MKKNVGLLVVLCVLTMSSFVQAASIAPTWSYDFKTNIEWFRSEVEVVKPTLEMVSSSETGTIAPSENDGYRANSTTVDFTSEFPFWGNHEGILTFTYSLNDGHGETFDLTMSYSILFESSAMGEHKITLTPGTIDGSFALIEREEGDLFMGITTDFSSSGLQVSDGSTLEEIYFYTENPNFSIDFSVSGHFQTTPTPEPTTLLLMGAGLGGLVLLRRRQKN